MPFSHSRDVYVAITQSGFLAPPYIMPYIILRFLPSFHKLEAIYIYTVSCRSLSVYRGSRRSDAGLMVTRYREYETDLGQ